MKNRLSQKEVIAIRFDEIIANIQPVDRCLGRYYSERGCDMELDSPYQNGDCLECKAFGCECDNCCECSEEDCICWSG